MGACLAPPKRETTKEEEAASRQIDRKLRQQRKILENEIKLLLLGTGESGKSTIARQLKIIYLTGFSDDERTRYRDIIYSNVQLMMKYFVMFLRSSKVMETLSPEIQEKAAILLPPEEEKNSVIKTLVADATLTKEIADAIKSLWEAKEVKAHYHEACSASSRMGDSAAYFFDSIERIADPNFVPTEQDLLRSRTKTSGVNELLFTVNGTRFKVVDVGGQRSERKKWIHSFQEVTSLIFCVAMSEYDLMLAEDLTVNRMVESLALFDEIVNCQWFSETPVILFLNKSDLFAEKIRRVDLNVCFPDYTGGKDLTKGTQYLVERFTLLNKSRTKNVYCHVTCATNTDNITHVFQDVQDVIIKLSLARSGL